MQEKDIKNVFGPLEIIMENDRDEAWSMWEEVGKDAAEGKWNDASERHDFYLYRIKK